MLQWNCVSDGEEECTKAVCPKMTIMSAGEVLNSYLAALLENQNSVSRIHVNSLKLLVIPIIRDLLPLAFLDTHVWLSFACS